MPNRHAPSNKAAKKSIGEVVSDRLRAVVTSFVKPLKNPKPEEFDFPLSMLVISSARSGHGSKIEWLTCADAKVPGKKDGWSHAVCVTRDMLLLIKRMDDDFALGLGEALDAVLARHPGVRYDMEQAMKRQAAAEQPGMVPRIVRDGTGKRIVTDLGEAALETGSGVGGGNVRKH